MSPRPVGTALMLCWVHGPARAVVAPPSWKQSDAGSVSWKNVPLPGGALIVLDAWALIAFLKGEPQASPVRDAWLSEGAAVSVVNLGEIFYLRLRSHGEPDATMRIDLLRSELDVVPAAWPIVKDAGRIKAGGGLSYADAFCVATARSLGADLWTGDPEIIQLASTFDCVVRDLR